MSMARMRAGDLVRDILFANHAVDGCFFNHPERSVVDAAYGDVIGRRVGVLRDDPFEIIIPKKLNPCDATGGVALYCAKTGSYVDHFRLLIVASNIAAQ